jgi:hypothetical protein
MRAVDGRRGMEPIRKLEVEVRLKMEVYSSDEEFIGTIKQVYEVDFLVDRPFERDFYVPFAAIQDVFNEYLLLAAPSEEIDHMDWPTTATRKPSSEV